MKLNFKIALVLILVLAVFAFISWRLNAVGPDWFTAIATIALAVTAFFTVIRDEVRHWIRRPEFGVNFAPQSPDCSQIPTEVRTQVLEEGAGVHHIREEIRRAETHYIRARIQNTGDLGAEDAEVSVLEVRRCGDADNTFRKVPMGTPWNLTWAHQQGSHVLRRLPVRAERHVDLGHVIDPSQRAFFPGEDRPGSDPTSTMFCLAFWVKSNTGEYLLDPGVYEIDFQVYAANAHPSMIFTFYLDHRGRWLSDEDRMYTDALGMRIAPKP
jgi:hypothetical protein